MLIIEELEARGLLHDVSHREDLQHLLQRETVSAYAGYDPTATSLHIGNLIPTVILARLQRAGTRPVALVGGATGMIGDPTGKSDERNLLDGDTLAHNKAAVRRQLERFFDFDDRPTGALMVDNASWFGEIGFITFLRDIGKHLTINYMMAKDAVRSRLEDRASGISYTEFSYMLLQAYDFVHLAESHGCRLQIGGSDQWGNITAGIELQRKLGRQTIYGLTGPLLLDASGEKMGKTSTGERIWLDPSMTSPYAFYQYWLNTSDDDVARFLRIFSWRPISEIDELLNAHREAPERRLGQQALADDITTWVHSAAATRSAIAASRVMFGGALDDLHDRDLLPLAADLPTTTIPRGQLEGGVPMLDLLVMTQLAASKGAARRLLQGGGIYINNVRVTELAKTVTLKDLGTESIIILRSGKKNYHLLLAPSSAQ